VLDLLLEWSPTVAALPCQSRPPARPAGARAGWPGAPGVGGDRLVAEGGGAPGYQRGGHS